MALHRVTSWLTSLLFLFVPTFTDLGLHLPNKALISGFFSKALCSEDSELLSIEKKIVPNPHMEIKANPVLHHKINVRKYHKGLIFLLMTALMLSVML